MSESVTTICNQALGQIGANRIADFDSDTENSPEHRQCRLHYEPTRDALIRSHWWRFASDRKALSQDTVTPAFEWDYQYFLPTDFLRMKSIYENRFSDENILPYALEGNLLLTNESEMSIRYIKKVVDVSKFDPLFVAVLVLELAKKFIGPLAGAPPRLVKVLNDELKDLMSQVRALDRQETNTIGRTNLETWNDARYNG